MPTLHRHIETAIDTYLQGTDTKILFVWGPRRSGKTTIMISLAKHLGVRRYNFDLASDRDKFAPRREVLEKIVQDNSVILIDEVQNFPEATVVLKILHDEFNIKVIATGSSELRQKAAQEFDTLAGRFNELYCLPLSVQEIIEHEAPAASEQVIVEQQIANTAQIWGSFPEVYTSSDRSESSKIDLLQRMLDTYVLKDVIDIYELKNQKLAKDILTKIALQLGSEVSIREIANSLGAYPSTVSNYIEIFIKNYILIPLPAFKTNLRRVVSENRKLYFYDLGIRNILIKDFRELALRPDKGGVFENFIISELDKQRRLANAKVNFYFYREYAGREIDIIVEDYKKNYTTVEVKTTKGTAHHIFPIENRSAVITSQNYVEVMQGLF